MEAQFCSRTDLQEDDILRAALGAHNTKKEIYHSTIVHVVIYALDLQGFGRTLASSPNPIRHSTKGEKKFLVPACARRPLLMWEVGF